MKISLLCLLTLLAGAHLQAQNTPNCQVRFPPNPVTRAGIVNELVAFSLFCDGALPAGTTEFPLRLKFNTIITSPQAIRNDTWVSSVFALVGNPTSTTFCFTGVDTSCAGKNAIVAQPLGADTIKLQLPYLSSPQEYKVFNVRVNTAAVSQLKVGVLDSGVDFSHPPIADSHTTEIAAALLRQCEPQNPALASSGAATATASQVTGPTASITFNERLLASWRSADGPDYPNEFALTEEGRKSARELLAEAGFVPEEPDGTYLTARIQGTPAGVDTWFPTNIQNGATKARLLNPDNQPYPNSVDFAKIVGANGFTYEITETNVALRERLTVPVRFSFSNTSTLGTGFLTVPPVSGLLPPYPVPAYFNESSLEDARVASSLFAVGSCNPVPGALPYGITTPSGSRNERGELELSGDLGDSPVNRFSLNGHIVTTNPAILGVNLTPTATNTRQATSAWLTVDQSGTTTPVTFRLVADPTGLAAGSYLGSVRVTGTGVPAATVPIRLTVRPPGPSFTRFGVTNAGSYFANVISPGEALVIFGQRFGPPELANAVLTAEGKLGTLIGETRVLFDGVPAPMIYAVAGQISCLAPFGLAGKISTRVEVEYRGVRSLPVILPVAPAVPALLTADASGFGKAAALNQDGSFNSVRGAAPDEIVVLFGVGGPATNPASQDGEITRAPVPQFTGPSAVLVSGRELPAGAIAYLGPAPGLVHGVWQANIRIPANARAGSNLPVQVRFGTALTQPGVTISVR